MTYKLGKLHHHDKKYIDKLNNVNSKMWTTREVEKIVGSNPAPAKEPDLFRMGYVFNENPKLSFFFDW
jgi:hypothetical protein